MPSFMIEKIEPESFSHWGLFMTGRRRVRLDAYDYGRRGLEYVSVFVAEGVSAESRVCVDEEIYILQPQHRLACDFSVIQQMGFDPETMTELR
jgi:hypothetical protein